MQERIGILTVILLVLGLVAGTSSVVAAEGPPIAEVRNYGDRLVFIPVVPFAQLVLTVTGPCEYEYRQVVSEGELNFPLDETTIDGVYTYQLVRIETIDSGIIEILEQARAKNDDETPKALCRAGKLPGPPAVQSEGFAVAQREIIYDPNAIEKTLSSDQDRSSAGIPTKDFVINDDLIVDGSACIGFDCVNGESFGFDTLRLKEHNLRIKFDDTSTAASFPRNDWQLTANDSANGGASKFSIDDISGSRTPFTVEANARSHSLYVDDGGRIGSRTSTPSVEIHTIDGDTPTLRLQQDGSSGFAPQTWDVAGNETNFFVRDVTNGSTLPLRVRPGAPTSSIFIDVDGDVGLGTSSPDYPLHVEKSTGAAATLLGLENNGPTKFELINTAGDTWTFNSAANGFRINANGVATTLFLLETNGNLTIEGDIVSNGTTFVPDYVFEPDYELMPIADLAAFIARERHLPGVPSAAEIKAKGGLNVTQMQMRLLEKIEELTLYTVSQQETMQTQQDTILEQQELIRDLRDRLTAMERTAGGDQ